MKAICARVARAVHRAFGRTGGVLFGRYHLRILRTPREVRNALAFVLLNARKHWKQRRGEAPPVRLDEASRGGGSRAGVGSPPVRSPLAMREPDRARSRAPARGCSSRAGDVTDSSIRPRCPDAERIGPPAPALRDGRAGARERPARWRPRRSFSILDSLFLLQPSLRDGGRFLHTLGAVRLRGRKGRVL